ncbi:hypothetical protein F511_26754 [Dorcoceras hygrometricum]|uniref:Uncharacterized protein n=1 Tax=Dorcoceras hygrometricum TaxID=472368 RepID=A0A2Z7C1Q9_9LAMI|nr:hypothetical protein F511_26754 [Dorcoceras hygrometricum]
MLDISVPIWSQEEAGLRKSERYVQAAFHYFGQVELRSSLGWPTCEALIVSLNSN